MNSVEVIELKAHRKLTILEKIQIALLILLSVAIVGTFFIKELIIGVYAIMAPLLFIMGWTNLKIRKKTAFALLYFVFSIVMIVSIVLELI